MLLCTCYHNLKLNEVVLTWELVILAILKGGGRAKRFHSLKGRAQKVLSCLEGGGEGRMI